LPFARYSRLNAQNLGPEFGISGIPWGITHKRGEENAGTDMYNRAKFHTITEIYVTVQKKTYVDLNIRQRHTSSEFVDTIYFDFLRSEFNTEP